MPEALSILLTNKCNFNCYYCEFDCKATGKELPIPILKKILEQGKQQGIKRVIYDGGEPMMHSQFEEVLKISRELGYKIGFVTNAWFIPEKIDLLKRYNVYDFWIGIDGVKSQDKLRKKGSFDRIIESIRLLKQDNKFVALNFLVLPDNYKELEDVFKLAIRYDIDAMQVIPLNPSAGRASGGLSPQQEKEVVETVRKYAEKIKNLSSAYLSDQVKLSSCKYLSYNQICFDWEGNNLLCALATEGNIGYMPFASITENDISDARIELDKKNKVFQQMRRTDFPHKRNNRSSCSYCIERLRSAKDIISKANNWKPYDGDLLLTTACPVECNFCIYGSNPNGEWMSESTIRRVAEEYTKNDFGIRICGGEPFYDLKKLEKCLDIVLEYQKPHEVLLITSGHFGNNKKETEKAITLLKEKKLDTLVLSTDRWHITKVPLKSIENVITESKKNNIKIIMRFTTDEKSYDLMEKIAQLILKHNIKVEPHHDYGIYGKAELLDPKDREGKMRREEYFNNLLLKKAKFLSDHIEQSPKRSQRKFAAKFYPTTFPNGNIYGDSQCAKATFMGNINEKPLKELIDDFSKTLPGHIIWSERSNCTKRMPCLMPTEDNCDYCRNYPFTEAIPEEAIGRQYLEIDPDKPELKVDTDRELLLSFNLKPEHLNRKTGEKIISFLDNLKKRFVISRPLPKCLFGPNYADICKRYNIPRDCYECKELFHVENKNILSCKPISKKGPKIYYMEDREQIWDYFNTLRLMKEPADVCKKCLYFRRKQCDGLCFRREAGKNPCGLSETKPADELPKSRA